MIWYNTHQYFISVRSLWFNRIDNKPALKQETRNLLLEEGGDLQYPYIHFGKEK